MDPITQDNIKRYGEIKIKIKQLKEEANEIKEEILEELDVDTEINTPIGKFTVTERPNWEYSDETEKLNKQVNEMRKQERAEGIATRNPVKSLRFYSDVA